MLPSPPVLRLRSQPRWLPSLRPSEELDPALRMLHRRPCSFPRSCWGGQDPGLSPGWGLVFFVFPLETLLFFTKGNKTTAATRCVSVVSGGSARPLPVATFSPPALEHHRAPGSISGWGSGPATIDGHRAILGRPSQSCDGTSRPAYGLLER